MALNRPKEMFHSILMTFRSIINHVRCQYQSKVKNANSVASYNLIVFRFYKLFSYDIIY